MSTTFIAVYRGPTISSARLVTVSVDPTLVAEVVERVLGESDPTGDDPVAGAIERGRRAALRTIRREASSAGARMVRK